MIKKILIAVVLAIVLLTSLAGCTSATLQGWSSFTSSKGIIYYASMDGKAVAVNPSIRSTGVDFPNEKEWSYTFKVPASGGSFCGPSCTSSAPIGMILYSTPVASKDLLYVATYSGRIYAFNQVTGADRWIYPRESTDSLGPIVGNILLTDDTLYLNTAAGMIYSLDAPTGDKKWSLNVGDKIWTSPIIENGILYTGSYNGKLYAIASNNGTLLWQVKLPTAVSSSPAIWKNNIILGTFDHSLISVSKKDGSLNWSYTGGNWFWATPVIRDNIIYAACLDHRVYAINAETGKEIWQFAGDSQFSSTPVLVNNQLFTASQSGTLYIISIDNGSLKQDIILGSPIIASLYNLDNIVYAHTRDDYIHAISITEAKEIWKFKYEIKRDK